MTPPQKELIHNVTHTVTQHQRTQHPPRTHRGASGAAASMVGLLGPRGIREGTPSHLEASSRATPELYPVISSFFLRLGETTIAPHFGHFCLKRKTVRGEPERRSSSRQRCTGCGRPPRPRASSSRSSWSSCAAAPREPSRGSSRRTESGCEGHR